MPKYSAGAALFKTFFRIHLKIHKMQLKTAFVLEGHIIMRAIPFLRSTLNVAFETVPMFVD